MDETDNYTQNSIYVMNDGEDYRKPTKEISNISVNYVTNREQMYSLVRYSLCTTLYQKESYSYTVGSIGYALSVGDVLLLQDDSLLVGKESGARIATLITSSDENYLYGITVDNPVEFTGEKGFGCTIVQPEKYQASRCVTLEFCDKNGVLIDEDNGIKLTPEIGLTNTLYFKEPIYLGSGKDSESGATVQVVPKIGNLVAFGNLKAITEKVLILGITPKDKGQFELRLVPYKPELYNMGNKMPVFTANMTIPSRAEDEITLSDKTSVYEQEQKVADATASVIEKIDALSKDIDVTPPTAPVLTGISSDDDGNITLVWSGSTDDKSGVSEYCIYHKTDGQFVRLQAIPHEDSLQAQYTFTHITSDKFTTHYYYITAKDKMNNESEQSEILSVTNPVLTTPYEPKALKAFALRDYIRLEWTCEQSVNASLTPRLFKVEIRRGGTEEWESVGEYTQNETLYYFDRTKDGYKEADEVSQYQFRVKSVSVYGLESDYCTLESVSVDNYFGWKIGDIEITSYATEGMLFIKANVKGSAYGDKFLDVKYGDTVVAENSLAGRMFYMKLEGYQEVSDITGKDISVICRSVADEASKTLAGSEIDTSLYKTYKITKPNVTAYADKQGIHISWSDNTGDYYLEPTYKLTIDGNEILSAKDTLEYDWLFEDGAYPTKADILAHTISLSVSTDADSAMISDIAVDVSVFKGWIPDIPEIKLSVSGRTVPLSWNIQSDNVYDFLGCEIQVAKGYKVTDGKYSVITDEGGLEWYAPALGLNPYESLDNYRKGEIDGYLSVKGSSVAFSVPLYGQDNDGAVNTMYVYRARAFTKGGKSDWSDAYFIEVKPVSAYDVVKAWDINDSGEKVKIDGALGANQIFVNELSAICANLGYITDGALQTDAYNYWAVNDTPLSDGTVLPKGSFRVGGENEYMEVTPIIDDNGIATGDYNLTIVAKKFTTTTNVTILNNKLFLVRDSEGNILFKAGVYEKNPDAEDDYGLADGDDKNYIRVNEGYYTSTDLRTILKKELTVTEKNMSTTAKLPFALAQKDIVSVYKNKIFFVLPDSDDAKKSGTYADGDGSDKLYYDIGIYCYENNTVKKIKTLSTALDEITYTLSLFSHYLFRINLKNGVYEIIDLETDETKIISPEQLGNLDDIFDKKYPSSNFIKFEITGNKYFFESYEVLSVTKTVFKYIKSTDTAFVSGKEYYDADGNLMDVTSDTFVKDVYYEKESSDYIQTVFVSLDNPQQMLMVDIDDFPIITNSIVTQTLGDAYTADNEYIYIFVSGSIWSHILRIKRDLSAYDVCILYLSNYIKAKENLLINSTNETTDLSYMYVYGTYKGKKNSSLKVIDGKLSLIGTYSVYDENPDNSLDAKVYTGIFDIENPVWLSGEEINNGSGSAVKVSIYGNKLENLTCCTWYSNSTNEIFQYTCAGINESLFVPVATTDDKILFASKLNKGDPISSLNSSLYILDRAPGEIQESKYYNVCGSISETEIKKDFSSSPCLPNQILNVLFVNDNTIFCMYGNSVSYFTSLSPIYIKIQRLAVDLDFSISMGVGIFNTENKFTVTQKRAYETGIGFSGFYQDKDTENYRYLLASGAYLEFDKDGKLVTDNRGPKGDTGSQGEKGDKGDKGDTGETGTSITKVEQTETSDLPNGTNKLEITMSDGTKTEFSVKNGAIGDADIVLTDDDFNDIME